MIANAPRLGSVTSCVPSGVTRSPRKVRLLRRASHEFRPLRWVLVLLLSLIWATMGSTAALAEPKF